MELARDGLKWSLSYSGMSEALFFLQQVTRQSGVEMDAQPAGMVPASVSGSVDGQRRWFAVFTRSHHEKRVAQYYAERGIEHFLPISRMVRQWSHYRKVTVEMPLFPNYIFAYISRGERTAALKVPGALSLVGQNSIPAALPDTEI